MPQELQLAVNPDQTISLEWVDIISAGGQSGEDKKKTTLTQEIYSRYKQHTGEFLLFLGFSDPTIPLSEGLHYLRNICRRFTHALTHIPEIEISRGDTLIALPDNEADQLILEAPFFFGSEYINSSFITGIWKEMQRTFSDEVSAFKGTVAAYIRQYRKDVHLAGRIYFHLVESKKEEYPFAFLATYAAEVTREGKAPHLPLTHALSVYGTNSKKLLELLSTVQTASAKSSLVASLLDTGEIFHPLAWNAEDAFTFLKEVPLYEESGILCRIPDWWRKKSAGFSMQISIGNKPPPSLGMDALLDFKAELSFDGTPVSENELHALLKETEGLAYIKGRWIEVDHEKLRQTLAAFEKIKSRTDGQPLDMRSALLLELGLKNELSGQQDVPAEITNGAWLESVIKKLRNPSELTPTAPGSSFKAELRPYQHKGLNWLTFLDELKLGACLADDMGLGKTVQILAHLCGVRKKYNAANLLIVPGSLVDNWIKEIEKFLPDLRYYIAHPAFRKKGQPTLETADSAFLNRMELVITTYSLAGRYTACTDYTWAYIILDEAQAIKNPGTNQTKSVKKLKSANRIILTGTPVENRLSDLWSLFDFLNPGMLGTGREFTEFTKKLKDDPHGYARLRNIVSPYILRRLKTDKTVISDLPEKVEMKTYADLSKKQLVLYKKLVDELSHALDDRVSGIARKGLILSSIIKFKQICNHSDHYLGSGMFSEDDSGKFKRLREICEIIKSKREKLLVFTQFREIAEPLNSFLTGVFGIKGLILTGSTAVQKRKNLVNAFQADEYVPYMVLSLKAGGTGLNLTAANHVIHFDRWWNPAVENQATDRAFRIGQHKNVIVHKFITKGTIEEKIDDMIEKKKALAAELIVSSGESWITEMDNKELMNLFSLSL